MNEKAKDVKPCPFCGGTEIYHERYETEVGDRWRIICVCCMAMIDKGWIQQKADNITAWNMRSTEEK